MNLFYAATYKGSDYSGCSVGGGRSGGRCGVVDLRHDQAAGTTGFSDEAVCHDGLWGATTCRTLYSARWGGTCLPDVHGGRAVSKPMQVFVGAKDELFLAEKFEPVFDADRKDIPITILPDFGHIDMVTNPGAIDVVARAALQER